MYSRTQFVSHGVHSSCYTDKPLYAASRNNSCSRWEETDSHTRCWRTSEFMNVKAGGTCTNPLRWNVSRFTDLGKYGTLSAKTKLFRLIFHKHYKTHPHLTHMYLLRILVPNNYFNTILPTITRIVLFHFIHSFIPQFVLRLVHSLFQSQFSTQCDLVLPLSISDTFSLRSSCSCLRLLPCLLVTSFNNVF